MYKGKSYTALIKDCLITDIKRKHMQMTSVINGRTVQIAIDINESVLKEYYDPILLLGLGHPDVHKVNVKRI